MFVRCPFCHKLVFKRSFEAHAAKHRRKRPDGQQEDHVTLATPLRYTGPLDRVPRTYHHPGCGGMTGMPEEIIRTYLVNPLFYADGSFCTGCNSYVDSWQLVWRETGENMMAYNGRLRTEYLREKYGLQIPDPASPIIITPEAGAQLQRKAAESKLPPPHYLAMSPAGRNFSTQFVSAFDSRTHALSESAGMKIVVPLQQRATMTGIVVEWLGPPRGFNICRLWAPGMKPN